MCHPGTQPTCNYDKQNNKNQKWPLVTTTTRLQKKTKEMHFENIHLKLHKLMKAQNNKGNYVIIKDRICVCLYRAVRSPRRFHTN